MADSRENGAAMIVALLAALLLAGLGMGLLALGNTETQIAANYRIGTETFYAADAGLNLALGDLRGLPQWTLVLSGAATSAFHDATRRPTLPSNETIDLDAMTVELQAESNALGAWGPNNPVWRLFLWGPLRTVPGAPLDSASYLAVWVADDASEIDGNPLCDSNGRVRLHAEAYQSSQTRRVIDATVAQAPGGARMLSWREVR
jgi:hypothetical protein